MIYAKTNEWLITHPIQCSCKSLILIPWEKETVVEKQVKLGIQNIASQTGKQLSRDEEEPHSKQVYSPLTYGISIGIGVLVAGFVVHRKYKSRKMIDPDFKMKDIFKSEKK